jgi:hypothetical protein
MSLLDNNYIDLGDITSHSYDTEEYVWNVVVSRNFRNCIQISIALQKSDNELLQIIDIMIDTLKKKFSKNFIQSLGYISLGFDNTTSSYIYNIYILIVPPDAFIQLKNNGIKNVKIFIGLSENKTEISVFNERPLDENIAITDRHDNNAPYESSIICIE